MRSLIALLLALAPMTTFAEPKISTFLEGTIVHKSRSEWVLVTSDGTYWIDINRPVSWHRKTREGRVSFWVQTQQIKRFRSPAGGLKIAALK